LKDGLMERLMKECTSKAKNMEAVASRGPMEARTLAIFMTIIFMGTASMSGLTGEFSMEIGETTKCKAMALSHGPMEESTLASTSMI